MAEKVRMEWNHEGFSEILQNGATESLVRSQAEAVASRANSMQKIGREAGYEASVFQASKPTQYPTGRWLGYVKAINYLGKLDNRKNKTLSKAVHG